MVDSKFFLIALLFLSPVLSGCSGTDAPDEESVVSEDLPASDNEPTTSPPRMS